MVALLWTVTVWGQYPRFRDEGFRIDWVLGARARLISA